MIGPHVALDQVVFAVIGPAVMSHAAVDLKAAISAFARRAAFARGIRVQAFRPRHERGGELAVRHLTGAPHRATVLVHNALELRVSPEVR